MTGIFSEISGKYRNQILIIHLLGMLEMSLSICLGFVIWFVGFFCKRLFWTLCEYRGPIILFQNPHIIYVALKRSLTQLLPPTLPQLTPLFFALLLHYLGTGILGFSLDFALWYCKRNSILCQSKIKQLHWYSWNITYLHQQKIWPNF